MDLPPTDPTLALKYFEQKFPIDAETFYAISEELRRFAFTVSRVSSIQTVGEVHKSLARILQEGGTLRDFKSDLDRILTARGLDPLKPHHIETVFRTNVMSVYGAAKEIEHAALDKDLFPFYRYVTAGDNRVRPAHAKWHGFTAPSDDPIWPTINPPSDFNCRCDKIPVDRWEADELGLKRGRKYTIKDPKYKWDEEKQRWIETKRERVERIIDYPTSINDLVNFDYGFGQNYIVEIIEGNTVPVRTWLQSTLANYVDSMIWLYLEAAMNQLIRELT